MHCKARKEPHGPVLLYSGREQLRAAVLAQSPKRRAALGVSWWGPLGSFFQKQSGSRSPLLYLTALDNVFPGQPRPLIIGLSAYQPGMASASELLFFLFSPFPIPRGGGHSLIVSNSLFLRNYFFALFNWLNIVLNWMHVSGQNSHVEALNF